MTTSSINNKILFIIYPTISHYISILPIAIAYKNKGFSIYLSGDNSYKNYILEQDLNFFSLTYFQSYNLLNWKIVLLLFLKSTNPSFTRKRYKEFLSFKQNVYDSVKDGNFNKVFLDAHLSHYYIFLPEIKETYIINTKLSTLKSPIIPPLSSNLVFKKNRFYELIANLLWIKTYIRNLLRNFVRKIVFLGKNEDFFIKKLLSKKRMRFSNIFIPSYKACFYYELNLKKTHIHTLITGCKQIEYQWKKLNNYEHYVNLPIYISLTEKKNWKDLYSFINKFKTASSIENINLIYCSFGSITGRFEKKILRFVKILIRAFGNSRNYALIISTEYTKFFAPFKYENIYFGSRLPQQNILQICDLMITHGGMNTIKECIFFNVPMLVYPLNLKFDQPGNAARIEHKKLGLKGNMSTESSKKILRKTKKILRRVNE